MIKTLRISEELILRENFLKIPETEKVAITNFLEKEYHKEASEYPDGVPSFNPKAALYAAGVLYYTAQLILYRKEDYKDIEQYYPTYDEEIHASASLSADLCLRFIPNLLKGLLLIDAEDVLIPILEKIMTLWPYSAIEINHLNYLDINTSENPCFTHLFVERLIKFKNRKIAQREPYQSLVKAKLGNYGQDFWSELYISPINE